jgi:serine/threonine protein kinase
MFSSACIYQGPIISVQVHQGSWHGKTVAIKVLWPELAQSSHVLSDFSREIALMSTMRHPNTVLFLGACIQPPNLCIGMSAFIFQHPF